MASIQELPDSVKSHFDADGLQKMDPAQDEAAAQAADAHLREFRERSWRELLLSDPAANPMRVRCPMLALYAEHDPLVEAARNSRAAAAALARAGNHEGGAQVIPDTNHLFAFASAKDYWDLGQFREFSRGFLTLTVGWIEKQALAL